MGGELELAVEDLLEQLALAPRAPELELGVAVARARRRSTSDGPTRTRRSGRRTCCGRGRDRRRRAGARRACAAGRGRRGRARRQLVAELWARRAGGGARARRGSDLVGLEAAELAVLDEVGRVPVVTLARDVLADVVQQRRVLEHLAVVGRRARAARAVWSNSSSARRATWRECASGRSRSGARGLATAARRSARGSSDQSSGSWRPTASSTMPSRSAQSLDGHLVELEQLDRGGEERRPGGEELGALAPRARAGAGAPTVVGATMSLVQRARSRRASHVSWLRVAGTSLVRRRAATMRARSLIVPLVPTAIFGSRRATSSTSGPSTSRMRSSSRSPVGLRRRVVVHELAR